MKFYNPLQACFPDERGFLFLKGNSPIYTSYIDSYFLLGEHENVVHQLFQKPTANIYSKRKALFLEFEYELLNFDEWLVIMSFIVTNE